MSFYLYPQHQQNDSQQHNQKYFSHYQRVYASGETLANIAYLFDNLPDFELEKRVYQLLDEDGQWQDYQIYPLPVQAEGLKPYALVPLNNIRKDIKLVFRGTADLASLWRDLEIGAPGAQSFEAHKSAIYDSLLQVVYTHYSPKDKVHLTIAGHSLGASDAENFATYLCERMAESAEVAPFMGFSVFSLNSPGITHEAAKSSVESVQIIKNTYSDFKIQVHYGKTEHDLVQQLGQNHFLNGIDPSLAEVDLLELKKKYDFSVQLPTTNDMESTKLFLLTLIQQYLGRVIDAHKLKSYFSPDANGLLTNDYDRYKLLTNQNPEHLAEIKEELDDKANTLLFLHKNLKTLYNHLFGYVTSIKQLSSTLSKLLYEPSKKNEKQITSDLSMMSFDKHKQHSTGIKSCKIEALETESFSKNWACSIK